MIAGRADGKYYIGVPGNEKQENLQMKTIFMIF